MARKAAATVEPPRPVAVTASGRRIDLEDKLSRQRYGQKQQWQADAWRFYDLIPEVRAAHDFIQNALRRIRVFVAHKPIADEPPVVYDGPNAEVAQGELARLDDGPNSLARIIADFGLNTGIAGEGYLLGRTVDDVETWDVYSTEQLSLTRGSAKVKLGGRGGETIPDDAFLGRVWDPHPRQRDYSKSPMQACLSICDSLVLLERSIQAAARSRFAGAGVFIMPKEVSLGPTDMTRTPTEGEGRMDPFDEEFMEMMLTPIEDPGAAGAVAPLIARLPAELCDKPRLITFDRSIDPQTAQQREELLGRLANGLDLPAPVILGMGDLNHWNAWAIDAQTFRSHLEPRVMMILDGLTDAFLLPVLSAHGLTNANDLFLWFDAADLVTQPNRSQDYQEAYDRIEVSGEAYRAARNIPESEKPSDQEVQARLAREIARRSGTANGNPGVITPEDPGVEPADDEEGPQGADDGPIGGPPKTPDAITSAGNVSLGYELANADFVLRTRLLTSAHHALNRQLERAGAKLRRAMQGKAAVTNLKAVHNDRLASVLGRDGLRKLQIDPGGLLDDDFGKFHDEFDSRVRRAQAHVRITGRNHGATFDEALFEAAQDEDRDAAWVLLAAALAGLAADLLFEPVVAAPPEGEFDADANVPAGVMRGVLARAGGAISTPDKFGNVLTHGPGAVPEPAGEIATGVKSMELLRAAGLISAEPARVWVYGDSGTRTQPYEPHRLLGGQRFGTFGSGVLSNPQPFPPGTHYYPGDHPGCQCNWAPVIEEE